MFNKKDLVKQIKYESVNSLISNAQAASWASGEWAPQPTKGTGSPSPSSAKTGPSKAAPSSQSSVSKLQSTLKSLPEKLKVKVNDNIIKYFTDHFFKKIDSINSFNELKIDSQWWGNTNNALNLTSEFLNSLVFVNSSLNLGIEGLSDEVSNKMKELLAGYTQDKRGKVLLPPDQLNAKADELIPILEKIPSFYQNVLTSLSKKYGNTILNDETLDDFSEKKIKLLPDESTLLNNTIKFNDIDLPLSLLQSKESFNQLISKYFSNISNDPSKIKAKFNEIKNFINALK